MRVVGTAGHVDHGKSTLLRALTGMEPDRWEEERERGLTIDLGFAWTELEAPDGEPLTVAFVDVPGHERFIANMLAGAGAVPLALLVVAADDGWSAQSQEHLDILDLLDVPGAVVAVTKADLTGRPRARDVADDVARRLAGTSIEGAPIVIVDSLSGTGLDDLRRRLAARLADAPAAPDHGRPRLWVDRAFAVPGAGTVATGTLASGAVRIGDELVVLPTGRRVRVRGLQSLGEPIEEAPPGWRVALNLAGVDHDDVGRGDAVVGVRGSSPAGDAWVTSDHVDALVTALPGHEIGRRGAWHLHVGSAETVVEILPLLGEAARPGAPSLARLRLERPLPLVSGDRAVIRDAGRRATAGGVSVLDPVPGTPPRGDDDRLERATELERVAAASDPAARLVALIGRSGARPAAQLRAAAGVGPDAALPAGVREVGGHLADERSLARWCDRLLAAADQGGGLTTGRRELVEAARDDDCPPAVAATLVEELTAAGQLVRTGSAYAPAARADELDEDRRRRTAALLEILEREPFRPPPLEEAAALAGLGHEEVNAIVGAGDVVVCGEVAFTQRAVEDAVERLRRLEAETGPFTTAQARRTLDTTRKYAIPLLEHLDARGVTAFDGQTRTLRS